MTKEWTQDKQAAELQIPKKSISRWNAWGETPEETAANIDRIGKGDRLPMKYRPAPDPPQMITLRGDAFPDGEVQVECTPSEMLRWSKVQQQFASAANSQSQRAANDQRAQKTAYENRRFTDGLAVAVGSALLRKIEDMRIQSTDEFFGADLFERAWRLRDDREGMRQAFNDAHAKLSKSVDGWLNDDFVEIVKGAIKDAQV